MSESKRKRREGLIAIIGDEDTVTGFLLAGIGQRDQKTSNFLVCDSKTPRKDIASAFRSFCGRDDIAIVLVTQDVATDIRKEIEEHVAVIPTVLEIPSKASKYDKSKDSIVRRVYRLLGKDLDDEVAREKARGGSGQ